MALEDDLRNLSRVPFFAALEPDARRLVAFSAETRILRAGDVLFRRGEPSDCAYVLMQGRLCLMRRTMAGWMLKSQRPIRCWVSWL